MGLRCLHTSIFIETPSLEGLPTKAKEDPSPHEMRLSPVGYQPSISWSRYYYYYYYYYYKKDAFRSKILKKTWLGAIKTLDGSQQSKQSESQTQIESETEWELESESDWIISGYDIKKANEYRFYEKYGMGIKIS